MGAIVWSKDIARRTRRNGRCVVVIECIVYLLADDTLGIMRVKESCGDVVLQRTVILYMFYMFGMLYFK